MLEVSTLYVTVKSLGEKCGSVTKERDESTLFCHYKRIQTMEGSVAVALVSISSLGTTLTSSMHEGVRSLDMLA